MKIKSIKQKGRRLQDKVAEDIEMKWGEISRKAIMGQKGTDVETIRFSIECTDTEQLNIWNKISQCLINAGKINKIPIVVFKKNRSSAYAVVEWDFLLSLLDIWQRNLSLAGLQATEASLVQDLTVFNTLKTKEGGGKI